MSGECLEDYFSEKELTYLKEIYAWLDQTQGGEGRTHQLIMALRAFKNLTPSEMEMEQVISELNMNEIGMSWSQFLAAIIKVVNLDPLGSNEVVQAFTMFDKENKGVISVSDLRYVMTNMGQKMTHQEADEMIKQADVDDNGNIAYKEFVKKMSQLF